MANAGLVNKQDKACEVLTKRSNDGMVPPDNCQGLAQEGIRSNYQRRSSEPSIHRLLRNGTASACGKIPERTTKPLLHYSVLSFAASLATMLRLSGITPRSFSCAQTSN